MNASKMLVVGLVIASAGLAGCEGQISVDLGTTAPADPAVAQVLVDLEGVEFQEGGGGTSRLEFTDPQRVDLTDLQGNLLRLFTDEELSDGRYTGARLIFADEDDSNDEDVVVLANNDDSPLTVASGSFSAVDFTVDKDDSSRDRIVLTLDLRQSLAFDEDNDEFTLTPILRGIRDEDAGQLSGSVTASCLSGSFAEGGAVYLFSGSDATPDDRDGSDPEPYLTTALQTDGNNALQQFDFPFLPEGDYTLSLTCTGEEDDAATNDDEVRFQNTVNVSVDRGERTTQNL